MNSNFDLFQTILAMDATTELAATEQPGARVLSQALERL